MRRSCVDTFVDPLVESYVETCVEPFVDRIVDSSLGYLYLSACTRLNVGWEISLRDHCWQWFLVHMSVAIIAANWMMPLVKTLALYVFDFVSSEYALQRPSHALHDSNNLSRSTHICVCFVAVGV